VKSVNFDVSATNTWHDRSVPGGQVQIFKIIANDFIHHKAIVRKARTLSVSFTTCRPCCNVLFMTVINAEYSQ